jgi:protein O-GlcNAc transferase
MTPPDSEEKSAAALDLAREAFEQGRLAQVETACREILGADERCAGAWHLMGRLAELNGDLETAQEFSQLACELEPGNPAFQAALARVHLQKGDAEAAEAVFTRLSELDSDSPETLAVLAEIRLAQGRNAEALEAYEAGLRLQRNDPTMLCGKARVLQALGRGKDALSFMRKAVNETPDSIPVLSDWAVMLEAEARYQEAVSIYSRALGIRNDIAFLFFRRGRLLGRLGRHAEGLKDLDAAVALPGPLPQFHYERGVLLYNLKRPLEALESYMRAKAEGLDTAALHNNLGVVFKDLNRHGDAIQCFHRAVSIEPTNMHHLNNLGAAALDIGLNSEALDCFQNAVKANPNLQTAQNNIGNLLKDRGCGLKALPHYRRSMELAEGNFTASRSTKNNYLLCYQYLPEVSPEAVFDEHRKWGLETVKAIRPAFNHSSRKIPSGEKLRVGFVSADFCQHPVGVFMEPLLRELAGGRFEIFAYADYKKPDSVSERMKATVPNWRETGSLTDAALAKAIHEDRIDVLFELTGHTALNRLDMFALKPAPVQATYLGYPSTTGLPTIDFRLTDANADPVGMTEKFHTEKLVRLAECAWSFSPHPGAPEVGPLPASAKGVVTFGCFNNMAKWNEPLYELWLEILRRVPGSRLRLKAKTLLDNLVREELETWFAERGIDRGRLEFSGHSKGIANHLSVYNTVDIALDSYPYHGTTTTCEALWMGCPVVTLEGPSHVSRVGVSLLKTVGLPDCITKTREGYIEKAVALAGDLEALATLRAGMRERLLSSPLMDAPGFARRFENAIDEMVKALRARR